MQVAANLRVTEPRVLLRYALQKGWPVLPKSTNEARMRENLDLDFAIPDNAMAELDAMECNAAFAFGKPGEAFDPTSVQ